MIQRGPVIDGCEFPVGAEELVCWLWMFSLGREKGDGTAIEPEDRFRYFKAAVDLAFNCEGSICRVLWTPWLELIVRELIGGWEDKRFRSIAGASSSGKSHGVALYGLMEYWARPTETFFIVMSTTKDAARTRIWKSITLLWGQAKKMGCPGKLIDSNGYIKGRNLNGELDRNSGIMLKPAGKLSDDASNELLGINPIDEDEEENNTKEQWTKNHQKQDAKVRRLGKRRQKVRIRVTHPNIFVHWKL